MLSLRCYRYDAIVILALSASPRQPGPRGASRRKSSTAAGSYEWWDAEGVRYEGSIADAGTIIPSTSDQNFSASLYRGFTVAGSSHLTAANIKNGTTLFGIVGAYPSSSNPLSGANETADLDFETFDAKIKSLEKFEWFDADGNRYENVGDADIDAANIKKGTSIFGTDGNFSNNKPKCDGDGQTNCVTDERYKSMDTDASVISVWDIRKGKTAGGLAGEIVFYKNMANTERFNRTNGTGALSVLDAYDTIDDNNGGTSDDNNGGTFPTQSPGGWDQATGANWWRVSVSDTDENNSCNDSESCIYKDRITGLFWHRDDTTTRNWEVAIDYCENLTTASYSDWRLPTQKELIQAHINGLW